MYTAKPDSNGASSNLSASEHKTHSKSEIADQDKAALPAFEEESLNGASPDYKVESRKGIDFEEGSTSGMELAAASITEGIMIDDESSDQTLLARKTEFNKRMEDFSQDQRAKHIMANESFSDTLKFMLSIKNANENKRVQFMKSYPNKIAYKWLKRYDLLIVDTRNILIYKQTGGAALDLCQRVVPYSSVFDVV
jgi:hypothetical protein